MGTINKKHEVEYGKILDNANKCTTAVDFIRNYKKTVRYNIDSLEEILEASEADPSLFDAVLKVLESLEGHGEYLISIAEMQKLGSFKQNPEAQPQPKKVQ